MYLQGITFDSRSSTQKRMINEGKGDKRGKLMNNFESLLKRVYKENLFANKENS